MFDHAAARSQVARCIDHAAGDLVRLRFAELTDIPAVLLSVLPERSGADRDRSGNQATIVGIAREIFAGRALPRTGQHFVSTAGVTYRITDTSRIQPHHPRLEFVCAVSPAS